MTALPTDSTLRDIARGRDSTTAIWGRRFGHLLLAVIVVAGALGVLGVHSRSITKSNGSYSMRVVYPQTARAGLDVPFRVIVHRAQGFDHTLTLAVSSNYFRMFETQGFFPDADSTTNDGEFTSFDFPAPAGDTFVWDYDAYIQPSAQIGKSATVRLVVDGTTEVSVSLRTWLVP